MRIICFLIEAVAITCVEIKQLIVITELDEMFHSWVKFGNINVGFRK